MTLYDPNRTKEQIDELKLLWCKINPNEPFVEDDDDVIHDNEKLKRIIDLLKIQAKLLNENSPRKSKRLRNINTMLAQKLFKESNCLFEESN